MSNPATLSATVREHVNACFPGLWLTSQEHDDAEAELATLCRESKWDMLTWDVGRGIRNPITGQGDASATDPLAAIASLPAMADPNADSAIIVLRNFHRFLGSPDVIQTTEMQLAAARVTRRIVVVLAPVVELPPELARQFVVLPHELPTREQLETIARNLAATPEEIPGEPGLSQLLDAACGLTRLEAEGAFAMSLGRYGDMRPETVWDLKEKALKKGGLLTLHRGGESFDMLGGLDGLKTFARRSLAPSASRKSHARGIMLLGVPGTGKSQFAKALGNETNRPTVTLDVGALLGSLMGESEANTRAALKSIDMMSPCVLFIDEVEKAFAGASSNGNTDSGVKAGMFGTFLTWLNDHESDVFTIATSNRIADLPSAFTRPGRFDAIWFLDTPSAAQRMKIWDIYIPAYDIDPLQPRPKDHDWTGAEILSCCKLANRLDVPLCDAARYVVPVASTGAEDIHSLRTWADGRALHVETGEIYRARKGASEKLDAQQPRKVRRPEGN